MPEVFADENARANTRDLQHQRLLTRFEITIFIKNVVARQQLLVARGDNLAAMTH